MKSGPRLTQLEKALAQKRRPNTAKIKKKINLKKKKKKKEGVALLILIRADFKARKRSGIKKDAI